MEEVTALTGCKPIIDKETVEGIEEAFSKVAEAINEIAKALVESLSQIVNAVAKAFFRMYEAMLHSVATPKEWHLMKHAKRWRTRKKYRNRLIHRLIAALLNGVNEE